MKMLVEWIVQLFDSSKKNLVASLIIVHGKLFRLLAYKSIYTDPSRVADGWAGAKSREKKQLKF